MNVHRGPDLLVSPGDYIGRWTYGGRELPGVMELTAGRPPHVMLEGPIEDVQPGEAGPRRFEAQELRGHLRTGMTALLVDVTLEDLMPGQSVAYPRAAIVGLGLPEPALFHRASMQFTGLPAFFGTPPWDAVRPAPWHAPDDGEYTVRENVQAEWQSAHDGVEVHCHYSLSRRSDPWEYAVWTAPIVSLRTDGALTLDEWLEQWIRPLHRVVAFATGGPQDICWLELSHQRPNDRAPGGIEHRRAQVFGSGITQTSYATTRPESHDSRPLFRLADGAPPLAKAIARWRTTAADHAELVELLLPALLVEDLPDRARFLYVVQAAETFHSKVHGEYLVDPDDYKVRRTALLDELSDLGMTTSQKKTLKSWFQPYLRPRLESRLRDLIAELPHGAVSRLDPEGKLASTVPKIRNRLSHGRGGSTRAEVRTWGERVQLLCSLHLLRLLQFTDEALETAAERGLKQSR